MMKKMPLVGIKFIKWFKRYWRIIAIVSFVLIVLVVISEETTGVLWDGSFPSGEFHLSIQDEFGHPIEGATLNVFHRGTQNPAFEYPLNNYLLLNSLTSDENGMIIALHKPRGLEFSGYSWRLFWLIPMATGTPDFDFEISAKGYKTFRSSLSTIFEIAYNNYENAPTKTIQVNGYENGAPQLFDVEIRIFEKTIILKKQ